MIVEEIRSDGLLREYVLTVPCEEVENKIAKWLTGYQTRANVPGFRKGRAPMHLLRARVTDDMRRDHALDMLEESAKDLLSEIEANQSSLAPNIEILQEPTRTEPMKCRITFELLPEIEEVDLGDLILTRYVPRDYNELLDEVRSEFAMSVATMERQPEEYAAELGDTLKVVAKTELPGTVFDGMDMSSLEVLLTDNPDDFGHTTEHLVGSVAGDEISFHRAVAGSGRIEDPPSDSLHVYGPVREVLKPVPATIDDDLAKSFDCRNELELNTRLLSRKSNEFEIQAVTLMRDQIQHAIASQLEFQLPQRMVAEIVEEELESRASAVDAFDEEEQIDIAGEHPELLKAGLEYDLRLNMYVKTVADRKGIKVHEEEVKTFWLKRHQQFFEDVSLPEFTEEFEADRDMYEHFLRRRRLLQSLLAELPKAEHPVSFRELVSKAEGARIEWQVSKVKKVALSAQNALRESGEEAPEEAAEDRPGRPDEAVGQRAVGQ